jgi:hypothetical protein
MGNQVASGQIEILVRCLCQSLGSDHFSCMHCDGKGYLEAWVPHELLADLPAWVAMGIRQMKMD